MGQRGEVGDEVGKASISQIFAILRNLDFIPMIMS